MIDSLRSSAISSAGRWPRHLSAESNQSCPLKGRVRKGTEQQLNLTGGVYIMSIRHMIELLVLLLQIVLFVMNFVR